MATMMEPGSKSGMNEADRLDFIVSMTNLTWPAVAAITADMQTLTGVGMRATQQLNASFTNAQAGVLAAGGVAGVALYDMTQKAMEFNREMSMVKGLIGDISSRDMAQLSGQARKLAVEFGDAPAEIARGFQMVARAGIANSADQIKVLTNGMRLAKIEGYDVADAIRDVITATTLFGDSYANVERYASAIAHAANVSVTSAPQIALALKYVGGAAKEHWSIEETLAAVATLSQKGVEGSTAGISIRSFMTYILREMPKSQKALSELGMSFDDFWVKASNGTRVRLKPLEDIIQTMTMAGKAHGLGRADMMRVLAQFGEPRMMQQYMKLFPTDDELGNGTWLLHNFNQEMEKTYDMNERLSSVLNSAQEKWNQFVSAVQSAEISIGEGTLPALSMVLDFGKGLAMAIGESKIAAGGLSLMLTGLAGSAAILAASWVKGAAWHLAATSIEKVDTRLGQLLGTVQTTYKVLNKSPFDSWEQGILKIERQGKKLSGMFGNKDKGPYAEISRVAGDKDSPAFQAEVLKSALQFREKVKGTDLITEGRDATDVYNRMKNYMEVASGGGKGISKYREAEGFIEQYNRSTKKLEELSEMKEKLETTLSLQQNSPAAIAYKGSGKFWRFFGDGWEKKIEEHYGTQYSPVLRGQVNRAGLSDDLKGQVPQSVNHLNELMAEYRGLPSYAHKKDVWDAKYNAIESLFKELGIKGSLSEDYGILPSYIGKGAASYHEIVNTPMSKRTYNESAVIKLLNLQKQYKPINDFIDSSENQLEQARRTVDNFYRNLDKRNVKQVNRTEYEGIARQMEKAHLETIAQWRLGEEELKNIQHIQNAISAVNPEEGSRIRYYRKDEKTGKKTLEYYRFGSRSEKELSERVEAVKNRQEALSKEITHQSAILEEQETALTKDPSFATTPYHRIRDFLYSHGTLQDKFPQLKDMNLSDKMKGGLQQARVNVESVTGILDEFKPDKANKIVSEANMLSTRIMDLEYIRDRIGNTESQKLRGIKNELFGMRQRLSNNRDAAITPKDQHSHDFVGAPNSEWGMSEAERQYEEYSHAMNTINLKYRDELNKPLFSWQKMYLGRMKEGEISDLNKRFFRENYPKFGGKEYATKSDFVLQGLMDINANINPEEDRDTVDRVIELQEKLQKQQAKVDESKSKRESYNARISRLKTQRNKLLKDLEIEVKSLDEKTIFDVLPANGVVMTQYNKIAEGIEKGIKRFTTSQGLYNTIGKRIGSGAGFGRAGQHGDITYLGVSIGDTVSEQLTRNYRKQLDEFANNFGKAFIVKFNQIRNYLPDLLPQSMKGFKGFDFGIFKGGMREYLGGKRDDLLGKDSTMSKFASWGFVEDVRTEFKKLSKTFAEGHPMIKAMMADIGVLSFGSLPFLGAAIAVGAGALMGLAVWWGNWNREMDAATKKMDVYKKRAGNLEQQEDQLMQRLKAEKQGTPGYDAIDKELRGTRGALAVLYDRMAGTNRQIYRLRGENPAYRPMFRKEIGPQWYNGDLLDQAQRWVSPMRWGSGENIARIMGMHPSKNGWMTPGREQMLTDAYQVEAQRKSRVEALNASQKSQEAMLIMQRRRGTLSEGAYNEQRQKMLSEYADKYTKVNRQYDRQLAPIVGSQNVDSVKRLYQVEEQLKTSEMLLANVMMKLIGAIAALAETIMLPLRLFGLGPDVYSPSTEEGQQPGAENISQSVNSMVSEMQNSIKHIDDIKNAVNSMANGLLYAIYQTNYILDFIGAMLQYTTSPSKWLAGPPNPFPESRESWEKKNKLGLGHRRPWYPEGETSERDKAMKAKMASGDYEPTTGLPYKELTPEDAARIVAANKAKRSKNLSNFDVTLGSEMPDKEGEPSGLKSFLGSLPLIGSLFTPDQSSNVPGADLPYKKVATGLGEGGLKNEDIFQMGATSNAGVTLPTETEQAMNGEGTSVDASGAPQGGVQSPTSSLGGMMDQAAMQGDMMTGGMPVVSGAMNAMKGAGSQGATSAMVDTDTGATDEELAAGATPAPRRTAGTGKFQKEKGPDLLHQVMTKIQGTVEDIHNKITMPSEEKTLQDKINEAKSNDSFIRTLIKTVIPIAAGIIGAEFILRNTSGQSLKNFPFKDMGKAMAADAGDFLGFFKENGILGGINKAGGMAKDWLFGGKPTRMGHHLEPAEKGAIFKAQDFISEKIANFKGSELAEKINKTLGLSTIQKEILADLGKAGKKLGLDKVKNDMQKAWETLMDPEKLWDKAKGIFNSENAGKIAKMLGLDTVKDWGLRQFDKFGEMLGFPNAKESIKKMVQKAKDFIKEGDILPNIYKKAKDKVSPVLKDVWDSMVPEDMDLYTGLKNIGKNINKKLKIGDKLKEGGGKFGDVISDLFGEGDSKILGKIGDKIVGNKYYQKYGPKAVDFMADIGSGAMRGIEGFGGLIQSGVGAAGGFLGRAGGALAGAAEGTALAGIGGAAGGLLSGAGGALAAGAAAIGPIGWAAIGIGAIGLMLAGPLRELVFGQKSQTDEIRKQHEENKKQDKGLLGWMWNMTPWGQVAQAREMKFRQGKGKFQSPLKIYKGFSGDFPDNGKIEFPQLDPDLFKKRAVETGAAMASANGGSGKQLIIEDGAITIYAMTGEDVEQFVYSALEKLARKLED